MRRIVGVLIAIALGIGVFLLWPRSSDDPPANTEAMATSTTTTAAGPTSTTSTVQSTSTTGVESHVVETVEEAEEILRELWFGWFEGIYNQDEEQIREVVVLEETVETARESFGIEFERAPTPSDISFSDSEVLRSDEMCLAVWTVLELSGFREGSSSGVEILRWTDGKWKSLTTWTNRDDLWEADCESSLQP